MAVSRSVLGMNARNFLYIRPFNKRKYKLIADDKLRTKKRLIKNGVATPALVAHFNTLKDVRALDWSTLPTSFVLKPSHGYGGQGIIVVDAWDGEKGLDSKKHILTKPDLEAAIFGTIDGANSLNNLPDTAFIEERVNIHSFFKKYTTNGVPDIRIIVCNSIPIMAMLRLPTVHSDGKANLHLGAVGIGIDMRTGITTYGVSGNHTVAKIPGKDIKVHGIKIPDWQTVLEVATKAQVTSNLGFVGVDVVLDQKRGPLVLEINARPGLAIQIANQQSIRTRLERVANLPIKSPEEGVELAQKLFADESLLSVDAADRVLGVIEKITLIGENKRKTVRAKIDTGAFRTSIDADLVRELDLDHHHETVEVKSGSGRQKRKTVNLTFKLKNREITTVASYTDRSHLRFPVIIGRRDMEEFVVDPAKIPEDVEVR